MIVALFLAAAQAADLGLQGRWTNPSKSVTVAIAPCGEAWCGTVVEASDEARADAQRGGTEALVGTELMSGFVAAGAAKWRGRLFIPDMNKRSKAELRMVAPNRLKVTGCAVGRMICKSQMWTRIP